MADEIAPEYTSNIATQITRINTDKNIIRNKLVALGLASGTDNLDILAEAVDGIEDKGSVSVTVKEGETYTIPKGYHNGSGTVSGVAGGGNYTLQSKPAVTPTKKQQQITPDDGFYGLSDVTVDAIPDAYQDVTAVTAGAADVLTGKVIVTKEGAVTTGSMPNNGAVNKTLTATDTTYTVPKGYHSGAGSVKVVPEDKDITPTKEAQTVTASTGKILKQVNVAAIPDNFIDTTDADATADQILIGKSAYVDTVKVEGTMPNNEAVSKTLDATTGNQTYTVPEGYHNGQGTVKVVLEEKSVTPTKAVQNVTPTAGKVLSKVAVAAIPDAYQDVTQVNAIASDVLDGKKIVASDGTVVTGSMPHRGYGEATIDGLTKGSATFEYGFYQSITVSLTDDIEEALAAI